MHVIFSLYTKSLAPCSDGIFVMFNIFSADDLPGIIYFAQTKSSIERRVEENVVEEMTPASYLKKRALP